MAIEYRSGADALPVMRFLELTGKIWPRSYNVFLAAEALRRGGEVYPRVIEDFLEVG